VKRPPFDPNRARGDKFAEGLFDPTPVRRASEGEPIAPSDAPQVPSAPAPSTATSRPAPNEVTVGQFSQMITRTLEEGLRGNFRIKGEIANLSVRNHIYFTLKDAEAVLSCAMWSSDAARLNFRPREGDAVVATGKIGHYAPQGKTQLYVSRLEPQGMGDLQARFEALVKELRALGYFEDARKKPMPAMPRRVAVVTSATGAALQDVLKTARTRCPAVEILVVDVRVQGDGAASEVARALKALDRRRDELALDAVIVTRGGGSREDLWAFNERVVADAAFAMHIPLVAAIGHEVDTSIIELVADLRASTPTQAAMLLLPDLVELRARHERLGRDLRNAMRWSIQSRRDRLAALASRPELASPALRLSRERERTLALAARMRHALLGRASSRRATLDGLSERLRRVSPASRASAARASLDALGPRLSRAVLQRLAAESTTLAHLGRRLRSAGPEETIRRGYAVVTDANGQLVRTVGGIAAGDDLAIRVADGTIAARVAATRISESTEE